MSAKVSRAGGSRDESRDDVDVRPNFDWNKETVRETGYR
jgi:hypothetical protein